MTITGAMMCRSDSRGDSRHSRGANPRESFSVVILAIPAAAHAAQIKPLKHKDIGPIPAIRAIRAVIPAIDSRQCPPLYRGAWRKSNR
jgi:hypothetical protein